MPSFTVRVGLLLVIFGAVSYVTSGGVSLTAFIPSVIGAVLVLCGAVAVRTPRLRPLAMHVAALVALVGIMGTASALLQLPAMLAGETLDRRPALLARASMAVILLVYLGFSIRSFVQARLMRKA